MYYTKPEDGFRLRCYTVCMGAQEPDQTVRQNDVSKPEPEKTLFSWVAPERPFKRRTREFWVSVGAIAAITSLIMFLIEGSVIVILIISLVFLFYMLSTVEPREIKYEITNYSVNVAQTRNDISAFTRFWFGKRFGSDLLILETYSLPGKLELVIHPKDKSNIRKALSDNLLEEASPPDNIDKAANWLSNKIPGNN